MEPRRPPRPASRPTRNPGLTISTPPVAPRPAARSRPKPLEHGNLETPRRTLSPSTSPRLPRSPAPRALQSPSGYSSGADSPRSTTPPPAYPGKNLNQPNSASQSSVSPPSSPTGPPPKAPPAPPTRSVTSPSPQGRPRILPPAPPASSGHRVDVAEFSEPAHVPLGIPDGSDGYALISDDTVASDVAVPSGSVIYSSVGPPDNSANDTTESSIPLESLYSISTKSPSKQLPEVPQNSDKPAGAKMPNRPPPPPPARTSSRAPLKSEPPIGGRERLGTTASLSSLASDLSSDDESEDENDGDVVGSFTEQKEERPYANVLEDGSPAIRKPPVAANRNAKSGPAMPTINIPAPPKPSPSTQGPKRPPQGERGGATVIGALQVPVDATRDPMAAFGSLGSLSQRVLTGWFVKGVLEGKIGRPRRRFFVLRGSTMKYFVNCDADGRGVDPRGHIRIGPNTQAVCQGTTLKVVNMDREWLLDAAEDQVAKWGEMLQTVIARQRKALAGRPARPEAPRPKRTISAPPTLSGKGKGSSKTSARQAFSKSMIGAPIQESFVHVSHLGKNSLQDDRSPSAKISVAVQEKSWIGPNVPYPIKICIEYIASPFAIKEEGLFRVSGSKSEIGKYCEALDAGAKVNLVSCKNPADICGLLKVLIRKYNLPVIQAQAKQLESVVFPPNMTEPQSDEDATAAAASYISSLPAKNSDTLQAISRLFGRIVQVPSNMMSFSNLGTSIGPTLLPGIPIQRCGELTRILAENARLIWPDGANYNDDDLCAFTENDEQPLSPNRFF